MVKIPTMTRLQLALLFVISCSKIQASKSINIKEAGSYLQDESKYRDTYAAINNATTEHSNDLISVASQTYEITGTNDSKNWLTQNHEVGKYLVDGIPGQYQNKSVDATKEILRQPLDNITSTQNKDNFSDQISFLNKNIARHNTSNHISNLPEIRFLQKVWNDNGNKSCSIKEPYYGTDLPNPPKNSNDGFWVGYDNSLLSKNKTAREKLSCLLVGMNANILVPIETNFQERYNMSIPIPKYASNLDIPCNEAIQHMTLSWKSPKPSSNARSNSDSDIALDEEADDDIITIYDDNLYGRSTLDELEKALSIEDLMKDARFHMIFQQKNDSSIPYVHKYNYLSDIFLNVPFNLTQNASIITNGYDMVNHHAMLRTSNEENNQLGVEDPKTSDVSKLNILSEQKQANKSPLLDANGINNSNEQKNASKDNTYRMIGIATNLRCMEAPALYAYYCDESIVIPMTVNVFQTDNEEKTLQYSRNVSENLRHRYQIDSMYSENNNRSAERSKSVNLTEDVPNSTQSYAEKVQIFLVLDSVRIEAFRKDRNYAQLTHLKWDCINGWPYGHVVPQIMTIFMACFEIVLCVIFYLRYRSWKKNNNVTIISEEGSENEFEETASFKSDDNSPLIVNA